ncbi:MAG TPA: PEP-CTERM sorting domain-containing protein [Candidatus Binatia bacterium]
MLQLCLNGVAAIALLMTMFSSAYGITVYSESINGDLSNDGLNPTVITLTAGSNNIIGTTGGDTAPNTRDYFTVFVPSNLRLVSLIERAGTQAGNVGFLGVESGTQLTLPTNTTTAAGLLGWIHYPPAATDTNILPTMAIAANGSSGFGPALGPGNYTFWLQDSSPGTFSYDFNIVLAPEPSSVVLMIAGIFALWPIVRRRVRNDERSQD